MQRNGEGDAEKDMNQVFFGSLCCCVIVLGIWILGDRDL